MTCPLCQGSLFQPKDLSVDECRNCGGRFFILITTRPKRKSPGPANTTHDKPAEVSKTTAAVQTAPVEEARKDVTGGSRVGGAWMPVFKVLQCLACRRHFFDLFRECVYCKCPRG
jgi:hypothetical protein